MKVACGEVRIGDLQLHFRGGSIGVATLHGAVGRFHHFPDLLFVLLGDGLPQGAEGFFDDVLGYFRCLHPINGSIQGSFVFENQVARMEAVCPPGKCIVSEATYPLLSQPSCFEENIIVQDNEDKDYQTDLIIPDEEME